MIDPYNLKTGVLARADDRGIGYQTYEFQRHLATKPALVVDMGPLGRSFPMRMDRYPGATVVPYLNGQLDEATVRGWLDGLDVLYAVETVYDWRLLDWAREQGVATVVHLNPEFYRHGTDDWLPHPTVWWAPTRWRLEHLHTETRVVPVPLPTAPELPEPGDGLLRITHVVGHRASMDRNGTTVLYEALRYCRAKLDVTVHCQDHRLVAANRVPGRVTLRRKLGGMADRWQLYARAHLLVLPRRYGGLCLPANEAAAAGLGLVMTDCSPNDEWPALRVPAAENGVRSVRIGTGELTLTTASPNQLARLLDDLAGDTATVDALREASRTWARSRSWECMERVVRAELAHAVARAHP